MKEDIVCLSSKTASQWIQKFTFYRNRVRSMLSDIEFGEVTVSETRLAQLQELESSCSKLFDYMNGLNPNKRVNLSHDQQIIYNELKELIDITEEEM